MKWFRHPFSTKFIDGEMRLISDDSDGELPVYLHTGNTWLGDGDIERNKEDWIETVREHAPSNDEYGDGTRGAREDEGKERKPHAALIRGKATLQVGDKKASVYYVHNERGSSDWYAGVHKHVELEFRSG
ncbi:MAG: hypothetical protein Q9162_007436 [Coniocarpon cinnabarinum]